MKFTDVIKIDLRNLSTIDEFERLRLDNGIPEKYYDANLIFELKSEIDVLFMDSLTYEIFAQIPKKSKHIYLCEGYDSFLKNMKPLKLKKNNVKRNDLSLDNILDKISKHGVSSLNTMEKDFLGSY